MTHQNPDFVVGIGASAGGLRPIEELFASMPTDSGMAFVVVQHLSPDFKSLMGELLGRQTRMPVVRATDGIQIEANHVYLIPPKKDLYIDRHQLKLREQEKTRGLNLPIDGFFTSLAEQFGRDSIGIILSGSGSDGSVGIQEIQKHGGMVMVQSPDSASFDGMPSAAIKTKSTDLVCDVKQMPNHLLDYRSHRDPKRLAPFQTEPEESNLDQLCQFYREFAGMDFSAYKPGTIRRRLERRIELAAVGSLEEYMERIKEDSEEAGLLYRDLLVEVTQFFRDPEAFEELRKTIIPQAIEDGADDEEFRAWVCGCATGEEAYSIAMLIHDCLKSKGLIRKPFRVFATDVHPLSLKIAGDGTFREAVLKDLPGGFRQRYFNEVENGLRVKQEIRQRIIFANNNVIKDPPFTKLNLISCRNLLIYLKQRAQRRALSIFHFGLNKNGILFLGPSETLGELSGEFEEIDRRWRIFKKCNDRRLPEAIRVPVGFESDGKKQFPRSANSLTEIREQVLANSAVDALVNRYVPASFLVNEHSQLVHIIGKSRLLLTFPEGKPDNNVLNLLDNKLGDPINAAIHRCRTQGTPVSLKGIRIQFPGEEEASFQIKIEPIEQLKEIFYLISFIEMDVVIPPPQEIEFKPLANAEEQIDQLTMQLTYTRETLQATLEELESSNEELQATNEELIASNEELQSTNEELQSTNEELHTVNLENRKRIDQLNDVTEDLEMLLSRTATGILFLDKELNIRKYTRAVKRYFDLQPSDIGRSITNFTHQTGVENLYDRIREALDSGSEFTLESAIPDKESLFVEVAMKREQDEVVGVMLTVGQKTVQGFGVASRQFFLPAGAGFWQWPDLKKDEMWWSPRCYQLLGMEEGSTPSSFLSWKDLVHEQDTHRLRNAGTEQCLFVQQGYLIVRMRCADQQYRKFEYRAAFVMDEHDKPKSMMGSFSPFEQTGDLVQNIGG